MVPQPHKRPSRHWLFCASAILASPVLSPPAIRVFKSTPPASSSTATKMVISFKKSDEGQQLQASSSVNNIAIPKQIFDVKRSLAEDLLIVNESPGSITPSKHVVVVMDAMKDFSTEPLRWALDNVTGSGYTVTLLGIMPWLNLPLSCKTWLDIWTLNLEDLPGLIERNEWKSDLKYQKVRGIIELCEKYGVVPNMKVAMGYPLRLVVLEQTTSLSATWIVFDKHHRRNRGFYAKRIPCNVVMMNNEGEVEMIKVRPMIDNGDIMATESPASLPIAPKVIISEKLKELFRPKEQKIINQEEAQLARASPCIYAV
ncbi:hypothetical protein Sjap_005986 [Stephania japonica]|uniref:Uncharacterized protein n=1 Tax=Stephania japonica TaxID=461633 RepID=A0AAP0K519_9MAGN